MEPIGKTPKKPNIVRAKRELLGSRKGKGKEKGTGIIKGNRVVEEYYMHE
jgi:hypothetical protein